MTTFKLLKFKIAKRTIWCIKTTDGQALIEAITSIGIIIVGVFGALAFLSSSISLNRIVTNQYTATYLAAALIEDVRNCIDVNGWNSRNSCFNIAESNLKTDLLGGKSEINNTKFNYNVYDCDIDDNDVIGACANVGWTEKGEKDYNVNLEDRFYNWR